MKWACETNHDTGYWSAICVPERAPWTDDPPFVIIKVPTDDSADDKVYVSRNEYVAAPEDDIGPFDTLDAVIAVAELLNAQEGWTDE